MHSLIQWPRAKYWDKCWNPMLGCKPISPACAYCYAKFLTKQRFKHSFVPHETGKLNPPRKDVVFCGNMTDLFGDWVDAEARIDFIVKTLGYSRKATYLWLTKRPEALCGTLSHSTMIPSDDPSCDIPFRHVEFCNQFFGFTGENQEWYDKRFKLWRRLFPSWANGWLSAEPLLGPLDLHLSYIAPEDLPFKWIVVGCESGPKRRPCKIEWVENIVAQAMSRDIPVFVKQLSINGMCETDIAKFPAHLQIRQVPWKANSKEVAK